MNSYDLNLCTCLPKSDAPKVMPPVYFHKNEERQREQKKNPFDRAFVQLRNAIFLHSHEHWKCISASNEQKTTGALVEICTSRNDAFLSFFLSEQQWRNPPIRADKLIEALFITWLDKCAGSRRMSHTLLVALLKRLNHRLTLFTYTVWNRPTPENRFFFT